MTSYAPLFAHVEGWQWKPDLIWFDNLQSFGTPNYYVQQLYSLNKGTDVVPLNLNNEAVEGQDGCYASATLDNDTHELIIKFVNTNNAMQKADFLMSGIKSVTKASLTLLQSDNLDSVNSMDQPLAVSPKITDIEFKDNHIKLNLKPYSFNIIRVSIEK